jgi:hypothetical protein
MSAAEENLKKRVINVLRSQACMNIKFTIVGSTVMGYGYGYVADVIEQGGISIRIGNTGAFTATYDHHGPTPSAPGSWQRIGGASPPRGRSSQPPRPRVMHEVLLARAAVKRSQGRPRAEY